MSNTSNRLNALYIISILKKYSSPEKPLTISEITEHFNADINDDMDQVDGSTVARVLETLCSDSTLGFNTAERGDFYQDIHNLGFDIRCVIQSANPDTPWIDYRYPALNSAEDSRTNTDNETGTPKKASKRSKKGPTRYFYYDSVITDAEISLLIDAIETYNYFDGDDIVGICNKLRNLHPPIFKKNARASDKADEGSPLFLHIDALHRIIKANQFAKITYCTNNYMQKLIQRDGYPRIIRPLKMLWSNGYYYLVCLFENYSSPINLRIDRISEIEEIPATPELCNAYRIEDALEKMLADTVSYRLQHPVMHAGETTVIKLLYLDSQKGLMNNLIRDTFGTPKHIRRASQQDLEKYLPTDMLEEAIRTQSQTAPGSDQWILITLETTTGGVELFAMQHCNYCKVVSPPELAEQISEKLTAGLAFYQRKP